MCSFRSIEVLILKVLDNLDDVRDILEKNPDIAGG